jgi:hypothetical protein
MTRSSLRWVLAVCCIVAIMTYFGIRWRSTMRRPPNTVASVKSLPAPPTETGCYTYNGSRDHQWTKTNCLSRREASRLPHPMVGGSTNGAYGLNGPCAGPCATNPNSPVTAGSVSVSFPGPGTSVNPVYSVIDSPPPQGCPAQGCGTGRDSFSVQMNTNQFTVACTPSSGGACVAGDTGEVQFTYQADPGPLGIGLFGWGTTSALCVWNVDVTLQNYDDDHPCVNIPLPYGNDLWATGTVLQVMGGESLHTVWAMSCVPWAPGQCWTAVGPDALGLCPTPTSCAWQQVSGTLLGYGLGSVATFPAGVNMVTSVAAVACTPPSSYVIPYHPFPPASVGFMPDPFAGFQCPPPGGNPIHDTNGSVVSTFATLEENNLSPTVAPASALIQACMEGTCWITYTASD